VPLLPMPIVGPLERDLGISGLTGWSLIGLVPVVSVLFRENQDRACEEFGNGSLQVDLLLTGLNLFRVLGVRLSPSTRTG
jgi:hypothetical protein